MTDHDKPWRLPDAKPMTFDEMTARAQYWYNAALIGTDEIAELREENERLRKRVEAADALAVAIERRMVDLGGFDNRFGLRKAMENYYRATKEGGA